MKKLEELINSNEHFVECYSLMLPIKKQITQLAIAYAKICLEKAAEEAQIRMEFTLSFGEPSVYYVKETEQNNYNLSVHKPSITNIELP